MDSRADALFTLPIRPRAARVAADVEGWRDALTTMGVLCIDDARAATSQPDLVVTRGGEAAEAASAGTPALIVEGRGARRGLTGRGYRVRRFLPLPSIEGPEVLLPLSERPSARYAFDRSPPTKAWKRIRNRLVARMLAGGVAPPGRALVAVASRDSGPPFLLAEATRRLDVPRNVDWLLFPGGGDALSRGTFHLFTSGAPKPEWVLKFARVPGYSDSFDRDERGLRLAQAAGGEVAAHAPGLLGRFAFEALHASVETAAVGQPLITYLTSTSPTPAKIAAIEAVAQWVIEVTTATAVAPQRLDSERQRLRAEVVSRWAEHGASAAMIDDLPPIPGALQHNDLGTWNIVIDPDASRPDGFTALDWESARPAGMPLWDLWYFLQDALAALDGYTGLRERDLAERELHAARLFRGEIPSSRILFDWTRLGVSACRIPDRAVGTIATLCWLHHGLSQTARHQAVNQHGSGKGALEMLGPRWARRWLADPALGPGWDRWR